MSTTRHITFISRCIIGGEVYCAGRTHELPSGLCARLVRAGVAVYAQAPTEPLPSIEEAEGLAWNALQKLAGLLDLEYGNKAELLDAYAAFLAEGA